MTACWNGRYSPSQPHQQAAQRTPWCSCQCPRPQTSCSASRKYYACCLLSFLEPSSNTPGQLQRLPRVACAALANNSKPVASTAGEDEAEQLLEWSLEEQQSGSAAQQQQSLQHLATRVPCKQQQHKSSNKKPKSNKQQQQQRHDDKIQSQRGSEAACSHTNPISTQAGQPSTLQGLTVQAASASTQQVNQQRQQQQQQQQSMTDDDYAAAQQRVRQLLISADINNPQAAAEALPDTVNDIVIALQVLATASKPSGLSAIKQYEAAVQQLSAAVVHELKLLLLNQQQQQQQQQRQRLAQQHKPSASVAGVSSRGNRQPVGAAAAAVQPNLAPALALLPPTKLAATIFSLGVLRHYDEELVNALESAAFWILQRSSSGGSSRYELVATGKGRSMKQDQQASSQQPRQQQQQPLKYKLPGFNGNQLGQLAQGFVYLDHQLNPTWQAAFLQACGQQLQLMKAPQLASLAVFLVHYKQLKQYNPGSTGGTINLVPSSICSTMVNSSAASHFSNSSCAGRVGVGIISNAAASSLDMSWVEAYLKAVAQQASAFNPQQLVQVLQAAAGLCQEHWHQQQQQQQQEQQEQEQQWQRQRGEGGNICASTGGKSKSDATTAKVFRGVPMPMSAVALSRRQQEPAITHTACKPDGSNSRSGSSTSRGRASGNSSSSGSWLPPLLLSFQQQLPDMKMTHLAVGLPAVMQLTVAPWPQQLQQLLLLQVRLLLPAAAGQDIVTTVAAVAALAGHDRDSNSGTGKGLLSSDDAFCDALLHRLHALLPTLRPSELAGAVETLALLRVKPYKAWLYELFARLRVEARFMTGHEVMVVIEGLAILRVQLDPEVLQLFVVGVKRWMGVLGSVELRRVVAALRLMYPRVLPGRSVALLVEELDRRAGVLELQMPSI